MDFLWIDPCGAEIPDDSKFCPRCGHKVGEGRITKPCPKCGADILNSQKFCKKCRWKVDPAIFEAKGHNCEAELEPDDKFCGECGDVIKVWDEKGRSVADNKDKSVDLNLVMNDVRKPVYQVWNDFRSKLISGDIKFTELLENFPTEDENSLRKEFEMISPTGDKTWIAERIGQFKRFKNLQLSLSGAKAIMDVVEKFKLTGDFQLVQKVLDLAKDADKEMNTFDEKMVMMVETCEILKGIQDNQAKCLETFCQCKPLIDWLRETMFYGLKEFKVFVDLASISAGKGDMEIDKVNCLHTAITGYSPLIFNLEKDVNAEAFLNLCRKVWKELESDPDLYKKLADTQRYLDWWKTFKQTHGSVEVTSLFQVEAINASGSYYVGNIKELASIKSPKLCDVLELRVSEYENRKLQKTIYNYEHLTDLQSRLMLVAGKAQQGKDAIERFMEILDAAVRLANVYTRLVTDGCVLFSQWYVKILCDPTRTACVHINFGTGDDRNTLKGRLDNKFQDVGSIVPEIARFLENCHSKWLEFIDQRREKFVFLNYFTIDQMVILQQELVKIGSDEEPSILIYPMLSAIKKGCTQEHLEKAMKEAKKDIKQKQEANRQEEMNQADDAAEKKSDESKADKTQIFLEELEKTYPIELAREALNHFDPEDLDSAMDWCFDNQDMPLANETEEKEDLFENLSNKDEYRFFRWTESDQSIASITKNLISQLGNTSSIEENERSTMDTLIKALEGLWDQFLNSISLNVSDYLKVDHLGIILQKLAEEETNVIERTFQPSFKKGEPNLVICSQSEIYNTVLSLYCHENDKPLPQSDEVLVCSPRTTIDMVEIFWRRALLVKNNKIYCLANADLLNYDVSYRAEKTLEKLMKVAESKGIKYNLVVICSKENENKSRIVAALDKYRQPELAVNAQDVKTFIHNKMIDEIDDTLNEKVIRASIVDFEKSTVRVVKSSRAGIGKTLYSKRMVEELDSKVQNRKSHTSVTIPLYEPSINIDSVMEILLKETLLPESDEPRVFHFDIYNVVHDGVDAFLFQLLVLGCLSHSTGYIWRKLTQDYYIIESMQSSTSKLKSVHPCLDMLPCVMCRAPQESLELLKGKNIPEDFSKNDRLFDTKEFENPIFQRPFQYLKRFDANRNLNDVNPGQIEGDEKECLEILLKHCGIEDPSWSEIRHFAGFLNTQLEDFSKSVFCTVKIVSEDLPGFSKFVMRFLIQMSRDFSTRSLKMSEESGNDQIDQESEKEIKPYKMRKTWEKSPHPYLFFNPDQTMTFLGFNVEKSTGNLIDLQSGQVLEENIMQRPLFDGLVRNQVRLDENFDKLPRQNKIERIRKVMGITGNTSDPDATYELTADNVKKILAIYMRFKCGIPVIIMGETGCGKTRLIKFMCALQKPPNDKIENMILMKVHGGTKVSDIRRKVQKAEKIAEKNEQKYPFVDTVLFFDEANTTEAIGAIKEIMCDKSVDGKPITLHRKLKIVAACNPYRKHSEELIRKLEQAGLGYHVDADKSNDKLGRVPMRRLVYRVQPLPQSMLPLVWDFGQLNTEVEEMYIRQMVLRYKNKGLLPDVQNLENVVSKILTVSQDFMRNQKDECSFVSLRDVERVLEVMSWFFNRSVHASLLFDEMKRKEAENKIDDVTRSLVLALGVCYHSCLTRRDEYRSTVAKHFKSPLSLPGGSDKIKREIINCQTIFLKNVKLTPTIARNHALKENVFMMIVCIELRIPMFLVGKPGSSKSLAKTIVADAMQGIAAHTDLYKQFKEAQIVSYQCSSLSVAEGITGTFKQCGAYQKGKNLDRFVSVVVLDEIGLAEDSPKMPLKALHPLLEGGCPDDEDPEPYKKVAFIGISNWALDPAKMNRGILVQREVPDIVELQESAQGIWSSNNEVRALIIPFIGPIAESYLEVFKEASAKKREFFGLSDFYSLLKMLYAFVAKSRDKPTWMQLKHCILRNFGAFESVDPVGIFYRNLNYLVSKDEEPREDDPTCIPAKMIETCLIGQRRGCDRYLLLLIENYGALLVLEQTILKIKDAVTIFGSSFPNDQEYTQVCRNINKIKVCMETGATVILLNLENLYESLYDALNQYYVEFGGERYVDLGLGSHRVKCRVHRNFRLIVVAEKHIVYDNFPIPLINRLEKHFVSLKTILTPAQLELSTRLSAWAKKFCEQRVPIYKRRCVKINVKDSFMGYHDDTCATIIQHCQDEIGSQAGMKSLEYSLESTEEILAKGKSVLLWCATPASVWCQDKDTFSEYFEKQRHNSLADYLHFKLREERTGNVYAQITTHSKLLSLADVDQLPEIIGIERQYIKLLTLQSFDTEQQFIRKIRSCIDQKDDNDMLLIVQCDSGDRNSELIACARYNVQSELKQRSGGFHVVFIIQLPSIAGGCFSGFQCGLWHSVHLDELQQPPDEIPQMANIRNKSVGVLLAATDSSCAEPSRHFDMKYLIKRCMQRALTKVKDPSGTKSRATDRLCTVFNWLERVDGDNSFLSGIAKHLASMLVEKEGANILSSWLSNEASKTENIIRAGTFRRFALNCIETKLIPMLTGILAFIDTNNNIDILSGDDEWKHNLWISMFNQPEFTQFRYASIISPSAQLELQTEKELNEIPVKFTSTEGKVFVSVMPFSWLIFQQIENALNSILDKKREALRKDNVLDVIKETSDFLNKVNLGKQFSGVKETDFENILQSYLNDFVYMVYSAQTEKEVELVGQSIYKGCRLLLRDRRNQLVPALVGFHVAYMLQTTRLNNFFFMVHVCPTICGMIIDFEGKYPTHALVTDNEITLDILALHMLVSDMEPVKDDLNTLVTRTEWIRKVCEYRLIFERIFGHFNEIEDQIIGYGQRCTAEIHLARIQWTKTLVVKLFIEHVCTSGKNEIGIDRCMPLWQRLSKEEADMKSMITLTRIEEFLQMCNKGIIKQYFGHQSKCKHCENLIECAPVKLPCSHVICHRCYHDSKTNENKCPICRKQYPESYDPDKFDNSKEVKLYKDYRSRCNSFFMTVISQLCFADGSPPSEAVVDKILSYIVGEVGKEGKYITKELTIFNDSFDPTPVVRSFLLQQLIQTSDNDSHKYLKKCFEKTEQLVLQGASHPREIKENKVKQYPYISELYLLVLHCMEDSLHQNFDNNSSKEVQVTKRILKNSIALVNTQMAQLPKIDYLSKIKFSLTKVAKYLHKLKLNDTDQRFTIDQDTEEMFTAAGNLCDSFGNEWPRRYCVKYLCKCYGIESFEAIRKSNIQILQWVILPELKETGIKECHDRYVVLGQNYMKLRDIVIKTAINEADKKLQSFIKSSGEAEWKTRIQLLLALYRVITMKHVYVEKSQQIPTKNVEYLSNTVSILPLMGHGEDETKSEILKRILNNNLWRVPGNIDQGMNLADQNLFCLLMHYFILLKELPGEKSLTSPLKNIAFSPKDMEKSFFPTMPEDQTAIFLAIIRGEYRSASYTGGELYGRSFDLQYTFNNTGMFIDSWKECPNGHPYILGNCGLPGGIHKCTECGEEIGGTGHQLLKTNKKLEKIREDNGHNLGDASKLDVPAPERKLKRISYIILRLLTHMSMYIGANSDLKSICNAITPKIEENSVSAFLMNHIKHDLECLQTVLGKSKDDVLVFVHFLLTNIMEKHSGAVIAYRCTENVCTLMDKEARENWELEFDNKFIIPVTKDIDSILELQNKAIIDDKRLGSDPLLLVISEIHKGKEIFSIEELESNPAIWKYRPNITVNQLFKNLETTEADAFPILKHFMEKEHHLRVIRYIPSIIRLQKLLIQKYGRRLFKVDATEMTIGSVKKTMSEDLKEFSSLIKDYVEAWNSVRHSLGSIGFLAGGIVKKIDKKHVIMDITDETSVVYLIPTHKDEGLCAYALLFFLLKEQNSFLEEYCKLSKIRFSNLPSVQLKDLSAAHLISYHPDRDLLPMILANCDYSLTVGQQTKLEYNYKNLERQIMDRFLFSKSLIQNIQEIEIMVYRLEYTNGQILENLLEKEKQERLSPALINQVSEDLKRKLYPDICDILDKLDVAISFILSIGSDPNQSLYDFMTHTLQIENPFPCAKAQQSAKCKNIMSLWMTVANERTRQLAKHGQETFPGVPNSAKITLSGSQTKALQIILNKMPPDHIEALMDLLFEFIVLRIDIPQSAGEDSSIIYTSLRDNLLGYKDACPFEGELDLDDSVVDAICQFPSSDDDGDKLITTHSVQVWNLVHTTFSAKGNQRN